MAIIIRSERTACFVVGIAVSLLLCFLAFVIRNNQALATLGKNEVKNTNIRDVNMSPRKLPVESPPVESTVDIIKYIAPMINFLNAANGYCDEVVPEFDENNPGMHQGFEKYLAALAKHKEAVNEQLRKKKEPVEGLARLDKLLSYWHLVRLPFVKHICETGFNMGFSTLLYLTAKNNTQIHSFDLGAHGYARPMAKVLQEQFPGRLEVTWGNSMQTVPTYHRMHPEIKCDFVVIDGGHSVGVARADYESFRSMASDINIVVMDDHPNLHAPSVAGAGIAWENGKHHGEIHEFGRCTNRDHVRGFSFGVYI